MSFITERFDPEQLKLLKVKQTRKRDIIKIQDKIKKRNTKSKRMKNLLKKCQELSIMCDLKMILVIIEKKKEKLKVKEYCSD